MNKNKSAVALGKIKSPRKAKTSAENGSKADQIRARLIVYGMNTLTKTQAKEVSLWLARIAREMLKLEPEAYVKNPKFTLYK